MLLANRITNLSASHTSWQCFLALLNNYYYCCCCKRTNEREARVVTWLWSFCRVFRSLFAFLLHNYKLFTRLKLNQNTLLVSRASKLLCYADPSCLLIWLVKLCKLVTTWHASESCQKRHFLLHFDFLEEYSVPLLLQSQASVDQSTFLSTGMKIWNYAPCHQWLDY